MIENVPFKRFVFKPLTENMYILVEGKSALVIDPCVSMAGFDFVSGLNISEVIILLTHEHFDHTTGVNWFKENFNTTLICNTECADWIREKKLNRPLVIAAMLMNMGEEAKKAYKKLNIRPYSCEADVTFEQKYCFNWHDHRIKIVHTPGHSPGSCCIEFDDKYLFSGDSLLDGIETITYFATSNVSDYREKTIPYLNGIEPDRIILPGHGEPFFRRDYLARFIGCTAFNESTKEII